MRRATLEEEMHEKPCEISIHALHEESDITQAMPPIRNIFQSTLSMRRATIGTGERCRTVQVRFQSTLSMRRATVYDAAAEPFQSISIHALHEESDCIACFRQIQPFISIHALHEESDGDYVDIDVLLLISIHALHEESD